MDVQESGVCSVRYFCRPRSVRSVLCRVGVLLDAYVDPEAWCVHCVGWGFCLCFLGFFTLPFTVCAHLHSYLSTGFLDMAITDPGCDLGKFWSSRCLPQSTGHFWGPGTLPQGRKSQGWLCSPNCSGFSISSSLLPLGHGFSFSKMGVLRALCHTQPVRSHRAHGGLWALWSRRAYKHSPQGSFSVCRISGCSIFSSLRGLSVSSLVFHPKLNAYPSMITFTSVWTFIAISQVKGREAWHREDSWEFRLRNCVTFGQLLNVSGPSLSVPLVD